MKCETCFWVKVTRATSAYAKAECEFSRDVKLVSLGGRCANWTFNGKPACKDCRYYDRGFCVIEEPASANYSDMREPDEWCGQFKGNQWDEMPPIPLACEEQEEQEQEAPEAPEPKTPERRVLIVTHKTNDKRARMPGDKVRLAKPEHLDRLRGCEFDHVIFDDGVRYDDVAEHIDALSYRSRYGTVEHAKDFFAESDFLSFSDIFKRRGE